jgi:hypothetical protein
MNFVMQMAASRVTAFAANGRSQYSPEVGLGLECEFADMESRRSA